MSKAQPQAAIGGFDVVAYFEHGRPITGSSEHAVDHDGTTWLFSSADHARAFQENPSRYLPAFDGHCAFATSLGKTETGDPTKWAIRDGRLFLNSNAVAHLLWRVLPGRIASADRVWSSSE